MRHAGRDSYNSTPNQRFIAYFDKGPDGFTKATDVDLLNLLQAAERAACFFKLPAGSSATVDIYSDGDGDERRFIFYVDIDHSTQVDAIPAADEAANEAANDALPTDTPDLMVYCVAECPPGSGLFKRSEDTCGIGMNGQCNNGSVICVGNENDSN